MKTKGRRQSTNIIDRRTTRDINTPVTMQGTDAATDRTTVSQTKSRNDLIRSMMSVQAPVLALYKKKRLTP